MLNGFLIEKGASIPPKVSTWGEITVDMGKEFTGQMLQGRLCSF